MSSLDGRHDREPERNPNVSKVYDLVTDRILAQLAAGVIPWQRPWSSFGAPRSAVTGKTYRGINVWLLAGLPYLEPRFLTFKQALDLKGNVRKGEKGQMVIFWSDHSRDKEQEPTKRHAPILRYYTVFNAEQCEGLTLAPLDAHEKPQPLAAAERIITGMPKAPCITHDGGEKAYYRPSADTVHLPPLAAFASAEGYYSTAFHELGHSTGHASRLDRHGMETGIAPFGSPVYSREELAAEFCAAYLCATAGIEQTIPNSAAYIQSWLRALSDDRTMAVIAAGQGQRAADYILGTDPAAP